MSRRGVRLVVAVLFALVCGAAAWQYLRVDRALSSQSDAAAAFEREARTLVTAVSDLRGAQQAYVAAGQGLDFWSSRVTRDIASLRARLETLRGEIASAETASHLETASKTLDDVSRMDGRARAYAAAEQRLLASDLIFGEGFEMIRTLATEIDAARTAEAGARTAAIRHLRAQERWLAAGVGGLGFLFLLILAAFAPATPPGAAAAGPAAARTLDLVPPVASWDETPRPAAPAPKPARSSAPAPAAVDLSSAASLCLDLARVSNSGEIPALLERITRVLDANGIVLWMADPDGRELVPTVAHGYPAASLARLGTIPRDSDNATAAAFREAHVHTVKGDARANGAIVAPLVSPGGCIGVMAAEVRNQREQRDDVRALASILAAQLATLIGVAPIPQSQARAN